MAEFWEDAFRDKRKMWGSKPAGSAVWAKDLFVENNLKNVLIPGIGYGRNAEPFIGNGIRVTGIEISKTAIELTRETYGSQITLYHGSVTDMPFDDKVYDGIFCYALIHLLGEGERKKLIQDCYDQLTDNGLMVFTAITKEAPNFGKGKPVGKDRYEFHKGAQIYYYDRASVLSEFGQHGLLGITEVNDGQPMFLIWCKKNLRYHSGSH
ncbi:class I SAM-dependent methyltransferase [Pseudozobellia thermophila]|uniref:Methyltransferase domain-containing protein n=1 Tax=Pseudozobellia thermophila TaxID=192903 RepID=A0A1M6NS04_9FLAO|nr:class I SAM-dependent methyltransferase [Pseudozobellia thermophila]SHJ98483.1 Methyltransferase domain-containing protein [Pseudozobellia thermophila]